MVEGAFSCWRVIGGTGCQVRVWIKETVTENHAFRVHASAQGCDPNRRSWDEKLGCSVRQPILFLHIQVSKYPINATHSSKLGETRRPAVSLKNICYGERWCWQLFAPYSCWRACRGVEERLPPSIPWLVLPALWIKVFHRVTWPSIHPTRHRCSKSAFGSGVFYPHSGEGKKVVGCTGLNCPERERLFWFFS